MTSTLKAAFLDFATLGPDIDTRRIDALLDVEYFDFTAPEEARARLENREVALVNKARIDAATIAGLPRLKLIVLAATGTDNVDSAAARERGVAVANVRGYCSAALAQHVFGLILALTQNIGSYYELVRRGAWQSGRSFALFDYPIRELAGRKLGIVGHGALGRAVARLGRCFDMDVLVAARPGSAPEDVQPGRVAFDEVLCTADVLSLHCPLTPETQHMIGAAELARMQPDALLINTARGGLVDGAALADALKQGVIGGAGIDVLPVEPPPGDHPLLAPDIPNLIVTPHVAWAAREARQRALDQVAENIEAYLNGRDLRRVV